ncbi:hypothetical protein AGIG_G3181 [Arapaima gigas]
MLPHCPASPDMEEQENNRNFWHSHRETNEPEEVGSEESAKYEEKGKLSCFLLCKAAEADRRGGSENCRREAHVRQSGQQQKDQRTEMNPVSQPHTLAELQSGFDQKPF